MATVSRGEPFFAFEVKEVNALEVSVVEENIEVYAVMSTDGTWSVNTFSATRERFAYLYLLPMRRVLVFELAGINLLLYL